MRRVLSTDPTTEGVLYGILNALAVTGAATPIAVASGAAIVYGLYYQNDTSLNIAVATPATNPRKDYVVLRANMAGTAYTAANSQLYSSTGQAGQTVRLDIIKGTPAATPVVPALTQNANQWEIPIAILTVTTGGAITVTDARTYTKNPGAPTLVSNRQGGDATIWAVGGANNYVPASVQIQTGSVAVGSGSWGSLGVTVTFPDPFSARPLVIASNGETSTFYTFLSYASRITPTTCFITAVKGASDTSVAEVHWIAIGPP